jgi:hypothetical protein
VLGVATAQILEQQDHFVIIILPRRSCAAVPVPFAERFSPAALKTRHVFSQLAPRRCQAMIRFQNAGAEELSYVIEFIRGKPLQEPARFPPYSITRA